MVKNPSGDRMVDVREEQLQLSDRHLPIPQLHNPMRGFGQLWVMGDKDDREVAARLVSKDQ